MKLKVPFPDLDFINDDVVFVAAQQVKFIFLTQETSIRLTASACN